MINKGQAAKNIISEHANMVTIAKGLLVSYIITIPIFVVFAYFVSMTDFPEKYLSTAVIITTILSIVIAGWSAAKGMKSRGWLNGAVIGFVYILVLFLLSSVTYNNFTINSHVIIMFVLGVVTGGIGGILGINLRKEPRAKIKR